MKVEYKSTGDTSASERTREVVLVADSTQHRTFEWLHHLDLIPHLLQNFAKLYPPARVRGRRDYDGRAISPYRFDHLEIPSARVVANVKRKSLGLELDFFAEDLLFGRICIVPVRSKSLVGGMSVPFSFLPASRHVESS